MLYKSKISRFEILRNDQHPYLTMAQAKAQTGCDIICNGFMYNIATKKPVYNIKLGGVVLSEDVGYPYMGYAWDDGEMPMLAKWPTDKANYITTGVCLVQDGKAYDFYEKADIQGIRGRTAIGFDAQGNFVMWCSSDAHEPKSMQQLQQIMLNAGCATAINLDGGGSSECITPTTIINTTRTIYNFLCIWLDKRTEQEDKPTKIIEEQYVWNNELVKRSIGATKYLVLHHAAGNGPAQTIHNIHVGKGWRGIAYNYYIRKDGSIYRGRPEDTYGGHTSGHHGDSIGICFEGNFEIEQMSDAQREAGKWLTADIVRRYPNIRVVRHKELNPTACPGANFPFDEIAVPDKHIYRVQVGAFTNKANAVALMTKLVSQGYQAIIKED